MIHAPTQQTEISVIIPVRNAAGYVGTCIKTLQKQTKQELEFIFVDDASTDSTCRIIQKAALRDPRIILLQESQQGGPGVARNRGIEVARGKYIGFVDADDALAPVFFEALYRKAETSQAWVVKGSCIKKTSYGQEKVSGLNDRIRQGLEMGESLLTLFNYEHWTGLYQREFINRVGARNGECAQGEDNIFLMQVMCHLPSDRFTTEDSAVYYYRLNETSISVHYDARFLEQSHISLCKRLEYMATQPDSPAVQSFVAEQIEEKIYHRVVQVWESLWLHQTQLLDYLGKCFSTIKSWLSSHPNERLQKWGRHLICCRFSASEFLAAIKMDNAIQHMRPMPENEEAQHQRDAMFLQNEMKIRFTYWRYRLLSILYNTQQLHYRKKTVIISNIIRKIDQLK